MDKYEYKKAGLTTAYVKILFKQYCV